MQDAATEVISFTEMLYEIRRELTIPEIMDLEDFWETEAAVYFFLHFPDQSKLFDMFVAMVGLYTKG